MTALDRFVLGAASDVSGVAFTIDPPDEPPQTLYGRCLSCEADIYAEVIGGILYPLPCGPCDEYTAAEFDHRCECGREVLRPGTSCTRCREQERTEQREWAER